MKAKEIADLIGGELKGDPDAEITGVSGITEAGPGDVTFVSDSRYSKLLEGIRASCVIVAEFADGTRIPQIKHPHPQYAFARLLGHFYVKPHGPIGISPLAFISDSAEVASGVSVHPFAYIAAGAKVGKGCIIYPGAYIGEKASLGEDCIIYPGAVLREGVSLGNRVIIHAGAVIGSDGFGYTLHEGEHFKIPQVGGVIIGDDVEVGALSAIDRATTDNTIIGKGTKIDNLVQIGHNVKVGEHCVIVSQVGIGGSSVMGNHVTLGGQTGVADHASIEDGTMVGAQSGVIGKLAKGVYSGTPTIPHPTWLRAATLFGKLPELAKRIKALEEKIDELMKKEAH